jgi:antitoxin CcdA
MRIINMGKECAMRIGSFDADAPKKATNVTINSDLLRQAKECHVNLSQTLEKRLVEILRVEKRKQWLQSNRKAINDYNRRVAAKGVFSDGQRSF